MSDTVTSVEKHGTENLADQADVGKLWVRGGDERFEVEWDNEAKVTPMGSLVFFAQYVQTGGLLDRLCEGSPLAYSSHNAPKERDVFGTILLSVLNGQTRYAHINALRGDRVGAEVLSIEKIVSEDSVRRAFTRGTPQEWDAWLTVQERAVYEPLLAEPYVLDIDNTVKPLYGHQEGAELGYNPKKPGRPSHNYHTYFIGSLRVVLGVEVMPGKQHGGKHSRPGLWRLIDGLPSHCRPRLIRGDVSYGSEEGMTEAEERRQPYLFKLRQTTKVQKQIQWWNVFTRLAQPDRHLEAITSRPLLLQAVGRLVTTGRRKIIRLTSTHALADRIRLTLSRIGRFLNRLARTAEQLSVEAIWALILSAAFVKWLRGKVLRPVMHGNQVLLQLPA